MNYDLVVCGVGGQGVLTMAGVIDHAIHEAGLYLKQSEVHGMAQRGGAVSAFVRIGDQPVDSDLIGDGCASMVLSVEPMEALRYLQLLRPDGWIVTDITPMVNVGNYPPLSALYQVLFSAPRLVALDAARLAKNAGSVKVQNTVVLGAAAMHLPLSTALFENQLRRFFSRKGERIVNANINAFRMGDAASRFAAALVTAGVASEVVARVVSRIAFEPQPVPPEDVAAWCQRLLSPDATALARSLFEADEALSPAAVPLL
ncbi:indolepyruvate oxidoreductase subunit beta [Rhodoferax sp.]|uniref:indolepyruvate oxidoreductase subunit beta n=1 Tax=Rhodoferax sp. TaxID=50421 RepID=UPI0019F56309|nr:indolepyruvate oxidoreductase subunit beta [Rhodoferax sp.]MBE0473373.1 indolepyruvate oxidoreductase subunit beta [Rhodoferax sp.]